MTSTTVKTLALGGAQLLALGVTPGNASELQPYFADVLSTRDASAVQQMDESQMRNLEASHLEVYAGCKWGKAAFDPVEVIAESSSSEVQAIFAGLATRPATQLGA